MTKRRLLYWGLPVLGALIGLILTLSKGFKKGWSEEVFDEMMDCFIGAVIWFAVSTLIRFTQVIIRAYYS